MDTTMTIEAIEWALTHGGFSFDGRVWLQRDPDGKLLRTLGSATATLRIPRLYKLAQMGEGTLASVFLKEDQK